VVRPLAATFIHAILTLRQADPPRRPRLRLPQAG
jgi:hypothetical protein